MFSPNQQRMFHPAAHRTLERQGVHPGKPGEKLLKGHSPPTSTACPEGLRLIKMSNQFSTATPVPFTTALLLVQDETNAVIDRRALREAGIANIKIFTSGVMAARLLVDTQQDDDEAAPDVVLCHTNMADMSSEDFVALIRLHPALLFTPVIFIAGYNSDAEKAKVLGSGFSGLLTRPYSVSDLRQALFSVAQDEADLSILRAAKKNLNTGRFDRALAAYEPLSARLNPEETFKVAMENLKAREWDRAIQAFNKTMKLSALKGESELGLATAWKGKGDLKLYKHYMERSGHTFAMAAKWQKARTVYAKLLVEEPTAKSPFIAATERLMREGRYDEAAEAFAAGYDMSPEAEARKCLAKSCLYADNREQAVSGLAAGLAKTSAAHMAEDIKENVGDFIEAYENHLEAKREEAREVAYKAKMASPRTGGIELNEEEEDDVYSEEEIQFIAEEEKKNPTPLGNIQPGLLSGIPIIGDAITVARMTWKLYNSSKK